MPPNLLLIWCLLITVCASSSREAIFQQRVNLLKERKAQLESARCCPPADRQPRVLVPLRNRNARSGNVQNNQNENDDCCETEDAEDAVNPEDERNVIIRVWEEKRERSAISRRFSSRAERQAAELSRHVVYDYLVVGIRTPDGCRIEGRFHPEEDCAALYAFAREYLSPQLLKTPGLRLLFNAPSKAMGRVVLVPGTSISSCGLVAPASLVHVGLDPEVPLSQLTQESSRMDALRTNTATPAIENTRNSDILASPVPATMIPANADEEQPIPVSQQRVSSFLSERALSLAAQQSLNKSSDSLLPKGVPLSSCEATEFPPSTLMTHEEEEEIEGGDINNQVHKPDQ